MSTFKTIFSRYEKKYVITPQQYVQLMQRIGGRLRDDEYGKSTVCNIYFDTPDFRLIRAEGFAAPGYLPDALWERDPVRMAPQAGRQRWRLRTQPPSPFREFESCHSDHVKTTP